MQWIDTAIAELRRLWSIEGRSASQIAVVLDCTRNAVIGKAARLGLRQPGKLKPASTPRFERRPSPVIRAAIIEVDVLREAPPFLGLTIYELGPQQCRYPAEDQFGAPYLFCGQPTGAPEQPYCPFHHERCRTPAPAVRAWAIPAYGVGPRR